MFGQRLDVVNDLRLSPRAQLRQVRNQLVGYVAERDANSPRLKVVDSTRDFRLVAHSNLSDSVVEAILEVGAAENANGAMARPNGQLNLVGDWVDELEQPGLTDREHHNRTWFAITVSTQSCVVAWRTIAQLASVIIDETRIGRVARFLVPTKIGSQSIQDGRHHRW